MSKIFAFAYLAIALALFVEFAPWRSLMSGMQGAAPAILMAGGLFTIAIAVVIRD